MKEFITMANANERIDMKGIEVSAYASPDGPEDFNATLSENREGSASRYLKQELKKSKVEVPEDEEFFNLMSTPEDWEGFKELMEDSDIQDKDLILRVLSMYSDPVVREREIRNISEAFEVLKEDILPKLRRSKFTVNTEKIGWSDDELTQWVSDNIDTLELEELLYVATLVDDNETKLKVYAKSWEKYPKCIRAANNLGTVQLAMGDMDAAKASFEAAKALRDHNIVKNNLGVIAMKEGDVEAAENLFTSAMGAGDEVNYNLGIIKVMQGDYESAKSYFGASENFNNALTMTLNGNPGSAVELLRKLDDDPKGRNEYLMAVSAAQEDDVEVMYNALRTAVAKNDKWKTRAAMDVEFFKYFEEDLFKEITQ
jgi:Flp pilus assembly protein TadD